MIVCEKCFCDTEIISVIRNKEDIGNCPMCKSKNVHIYDTDKYEDLSIMFDELISIYTPITQLLNSYPKSDTRLLKSELIKNWNIFNRKSEADVYNIITEICKEKYEYNAELFSETFIIDYKFLGRFRRCIKNKESFSYTLHKSGIIRKILFVYSKTV